MFSKYFMGRSLQKLLHGILKFQISFKKKEIKSFVCMRPYDRENFRKAAPPTVMILFQPNFF